MISPADKDIKEIQRKRRKHSLKIFIILAIPIQLMLEQIIFMTVKHAFKFQVWVMLLHINKPGIFELFIHMHPFSWRECTQVNYFGPCAQTWKQDRRSAAPIRSTFTGKTLWNEPSRHMKPVRGLNCAQMFPLDGTWEGVFQEAQRVFRWCDSPSGGHVD